MFTFQILSALCMLNDPNTKTSGQDKALSAITSVADQRNAERFSSIVQCISESNNTELWVKYFHLVSERNSNNLPCFFAGHDATIY